MRLSISGDIVLRAAKRGVSAGEMIGLVLSRYLLAEEFRAAGWYGQVVDRLLPARRLRKLALPA
jgi:S-DNA-T family DNA segregation ATPase FtsK/SpoIIIE